MIEGSKTEACTVAYHYCDYADKRTLEPVVILGSLARRICESTDISPQVAHLIDQHRGNEDEVPTLNQMLDILAALVCQQNKVVLILDGLDEVEQKGQRLIQDALKSITAMQQPAKVFVSSRENLVGTFYTHQLPTFSVQLSSSTISADIEAYTRHKVSELIRSGDLVIRLDELEDLIVETLIAGAKGM